MKTLQYYSVKEKKLMIFPGYAIDENGIVINTHTGQTMTRHKTMSGYNRVAVRLGGTSWNIRVARALASTFLGPPPTKHHTADHEDGNSLNDTLVNIRWLNKSDQVKNRSVPTDYNNAIIIERNGVELTAKEWVEVYKKLNGEPYTKETIQRYAQQQKHDFRYKVFPNLRGEVWKAIPDSMNKNGKWFISNKNRMKYKTQHAENVLTVDQLTKIEGYPSIGINGKIMRCHQLSLMMFRPREYVAKLPGDIILHKNDDKLDFNPFRLRWGSQSENIKDAYKNGKYDGTKRSKKTK
ncbi:hypothetical protein ATCVNTS1_163R [Acanthocystis turfacea Chlorella virus NTS-1]|nr:hypothetical protein ATCVNEJV3_153R [Acanthocystis turfacea Chlorella virus NE-JV-3]AGE57551.1 hypothetical protein ATCVNTS1_163R [Acanthocystis turfacea Chlorella virus NTS-1]